MRDRFQGVANDIPELIKFMNSSDHDTLSELVNFFSLDSRYCHPRELKRFWESLTESEKDYYRSCVPRRRVI
jgi:phosphopentomutase